MLRKILASICFIFLPLFSWAYFYTLSGYVYDENNRPISYVSVFIKNTTNATYTDNSGRYFLELQEGTYDVIYKMIGYQEKVLKLTITENTVKNVWLTSSSKEIEEIVIKASRKDPAYDIIKQAIENKDKYAEPYQTLKCDFYLKATDLSTIDSSKIKTKQNKKSTPVDLDSIKAIILPPKMNLVESRGVLHRQSPNQIKEIVEGYNLKGSSYYMYFLSNAEADFNFYKNLIYSKLTETPLTSPLNWSAVLSYKFKLLNIYRYNGKEVNVIEVKSRGTGDALFDGEIHIVEGDWAIKKLDLKISKKALNYYDEVRIVQDYTKLGDSIWLMEKQEINYDIYSGKEEFKGKTVVYYSNFEVNSIYPKKFFNTEVGVKTQDAYDKDSSYWNLQRPEPLTIEEQKHIAYIDSVNGVLNSEWYQDSIQKVQNKITLKNLLWFGQPYIDWRKQKRMYFAPVTNMIDPVSVGGFRVGYYFTYYKKYESKRYFWLVPNITYGFLNEDLKGNIRFRLMYDSYHLRQFYCSVGRNFDLINPYDAYINMFRRSNFYENEYVTFGHRMELFNGFYMVKEIDYSYRRDITGYKFDNISDQIFEDNTPRAFEQHRSFTAAVGFDYTYKQKYLKEPREKIVLGSKWPTIGMFYRKGINNILGSAVDYDRIEFDLKHQIKVGTLGTADYRFETGKFLTKNYLPLIDNKYQRQGDPLIFTNPFNTYQLLNRTFITEDWYFQGHYLHRFNGVFTNKIPLIRKLNLRLSAGSGLLYVPDQKYIHIEAFAGVERIFRFWRERFRIGIYGAVSESNDGYIHAIKLSIEYFDKQSQQWNF